ncbi:MAG: PA2169 family four-helix-bundle protein [Rhizobacter sp.]|nr:PA2169 family four-helix-bundle protein [Chlorobiales bacterium]
MVTTENDVSQEGTESQVRPDEASVAAIAQLNSLIETCRDGQLGYSSAADAIINPELKALFVSVASQRSAFISELQGQIRALGGDPSKSGTLVGAVHRGWIALKSAVASRNDDSILEECERGDNIAIETYNNVLSKSLPAAAREIVQRQLGSIEQSYHKVQQMTVAPKGQPDAV